MLENTSRFYPKDHPNIFKTGKHGFINWMPLPSIAMEFVVESPSNTQERLTRSKTKDTRQRRARVKDNDIVIPEELLEELTDVPPTPVSFNVNQLPETPPFPNRGPHEYRGSPDSLDVRWGHRKHKRHLPSIRSDKHSDEESLALSDTKPRRGTKKQRLSYRAHYDSEEDYYVQFQQRMAETNVGFTGGSVRKARQKASPSQNNLPMLHTETCTLHDKILAKYVKYKDGVNINNSNKPMFGDLYSKPVPSKIYNDPSELRVDLQPTVMGLRRIHGTNQHVDKHHGNGSHGGKYQHHLTPLKNRPKQSKRQREEEPEVELFSSKNLRRTKGSILTSPRSNRLLGRTRNTSHSQGRDPFHNE